MILETTKLHLGCADIHLDGFVNVDVRRTSATDLVTEAWNLSMFDDGTVAQIYSRHMIEHLSLGEACRALAEWGRVLRCGGIANIVCPDLAFHARQLLGMAQSSLPDQMAHAMAGFYGWQDPLRGGEREDAHRWGYVFGSLRQACLAAGFTEVIRRTSGRDTEPWHLNILAFKGQA